MNLQYWGASGSAPRLSTTVLIAAFSPRGRGKWYHYCCVERGDIDALQQRDLDNVHACQSWSTSSANDQRPKLANKKKQCWLKERGAIAHSINRQSAKVESLKQSKKDSDK